jgi:uncharacterized iron-regulated membrane protein
MTKPSTQIAQTTRVYRKIHKWVALPLLVFLGLVGITGLLLGWKKQLMLLPATAKGTSLVSKQWISIDSLQNIAVRYAQHTLHIDTNIDRIDIRPQKGIAKIVFSQHFTELQIDCATGKVLATNTRKSDFIEKLHDGSILDYWLQTRHDEAKLFYTTAIAWGLILLSVSGFFLWYNPIRIRKLKERK